MAFRKFKEGDLVELVNASEDFDLRLAYYVRRDFRYYRTLEITNVCYDENEEAPYLVTDGFKMHWCKEEWLVPYNGHFIQITEKDLMEILEC